MQADARDITSAPKWIRSSRCGPHGGNCVELSLGPGAVIIRDSKREGTAQLAFGHRSWISFLEHCRR